MSTLAKGIWLVLIVIVLFLANTYVPMASWMRAAMNIAGFGAVVLWLLGVFGAIGKIIHE